VHTKATSEVPSGYKIVKVRKPDGTIITVRRPIGKDLVAGAPTPGTLSKNGGQATNEQSMLPGKQQAQEVAMGKSSETPSGATPRKTEATPKAADVTPKKIVVPLAHFEIRGGCQSILRCRRI
jgi:histone deacetylase complex regulatory component SIN3